MRPVPTREQEQLRSAVRQFCEREVTPERLRAWETAADATEIGLLEEVAALGWLGLGLPTSAGGSGASLSDVAMLVSEGARGLLPRSVLGALESATTLAAIAPGSPVLASLASGDNRLALAIEEEGARSASSFETRIGAAGGQACLRGAKAYVPDAVVSELHLVVAVGSNGPELALVDAGGPAVSCTAVRSFGGDRQAHVTYADAPVVERIGGPEAYARLRRVQQALALAEMVGGLEAVLETTVAYVKDREQFGQKIALFQAVRHQIADMGIRRTAARHLAWQAITRIDAESVRGHEVETALAYVGRAFRDVCFLGHHLHGGAGFVVEHPLHLHSERAQSLAIRHAPEAPAFREIASRLLDGD